MALDGYCCQNQYLYITVNNNQYQFISMHTHQHLYKYNHSRQITFSPLPNPNKTNFDSIERRSKDRNRNTSPYSNHISHRNASPLHNLHYKYLPDNYISPQRANDSKDKSKSRYRQKENEIRTSGILKINSKIKNILQSIEQQQKRNQISAEKITVYDHSRASQEMRSRSKTSKTPYNCNPKSLQKRQYTNYCDRIQYKTPLKDKNLNQVEIKSITNKYLNRSSTKQKQHLLFIQKPNQYPTSLNRQKQNKRYQPNEQKLGNSSTSYNLMNSRYQNYSASRIKKVYDQPVLIKGKDVDNQINKIQVKIQQFQQLKKSMHINYPPVDQNKSQTNDSINQGLSKLSLTKDMKVPESNVKTSIIDNFSKISENASKRQQSSINQGDSSFMKSSFNIGCGMVTSQIFNPKEKVCSEDVNVPKLLRNLNKRKKQNKTNNQVTNLNQIESSVSQFFNTNTQTPLTIQTSRQIPAPLAASQLNAAMTSLASKKQEPSQLRRLLNSLQQQIKIDQQLSKAKKWFKNYKDDKKWQNLQALLKKQVSWLSRNKMKQVYTLNSQEQNPFYTPRQSDFTMANLIEVYKQSQRNWLRNICSNFCRDKLKEQSFVEQNIDISRRGTISIEDIVRFINYQLDTFYRNRDIFLIYQRLRKEKVLSFKDLLECFTNKTY